MGILQIIGRALTRLSVKSSKRAANRKDSDVDVDTGV